LYLLIYKYIAHEKAKLYNLHYTSLLTYIITHIAQ